MVKMYVGDIGSEIILKTGLLTASANKLSIIGRRPDFSEFEWLAGTFESDSIIYTTIEGDLDVAGLWTVHSKVELPEGTWLGEAVKFEVFRKFN
jgi:hypothetical protein